MSATGHNAALTPSHLAISDLLAVLRKAGARHLSEEALRRDIAAGAPVNPDGTVNLLHYAAWLTKAAGRGD